MRRHVLAVVVLAVLAGCGGLSTGGGEETPTVTPAPVPDQGSMDGVSADRIDGERIAHDHETILANASYTATESVRLQRDGNATVLARTHVQAAENGTLVRAEEGFTERNDGEPTTTVDVWWNGDRGAHRESFGEHQFYHDVPDLNLSRYVLLGEGYRDVFDAVQVMSVERGDDAVVITGAFDDATVVPRTGALGAVENATISMRIRGDGLVERMAIGYDANYATHGRHRVRYALSYTDVGATAVEPPAWLRNFSGFDDTDG